MEGGAARGGPPSPGSTIAESPSARTRVGGSSNQYKCVSQAQSELLKPRSTSDAPGMAAILAAHWCSRRTPQEYMTYSSLAYRRR
jgi:hypothetical protein